MPVSITQTIMGTPGEVVSVREAGWKKIHATLDPENVSPYACILEKRNRDKCVQDSKFYAHAHNYPPVPHTDTPLHLAACP